MLLHVITICFFAFLPGLRGFASTIVYNNYRIFPPPSSCAALLHVFAAPQAFAPGTLEQHMDKKRGNDESMIGKSDRTHGFLRTLKPQKLSSKFINMFFFKIYRDFKNFEASSIGLWCCIHVFDVEKYYKHGTQPAGCIKHVFLRRKFLNPPCLCTGRCKECEALQA